MQTKLGGVRRHKEVWADFTDGFTAKASRGIRIGNITIYDTIEAVLS